MKQNGQTPIYMRLRDALAEQIKGELISPGQKLDSERRMAERLGVARMTVRQALLLLEGEGLIYREDRRGYFVSPKRLVSDPTNHKNIYRLFQDSGHQQQADSSKAMNYAADYSLANLCIPRTANWYIPV